MSIGTNHFTKKAYGRIYVMPLPSHSQVELGQGSLLERVEKIVRGVDEYEWGYYAKGLVALFNGKVELIYTHKFEPCMDTITLRCWREGISVWCISQRGEFFGLDECDKAALALEAENKARARAVGTSPSIT